MQQFILVEKLKKLIFVIIFLFISEPAYTLEYDVQDVAFLSHGVKLSGTIVFPKTSKSHAAVVFVHGSGEQTRSLHWAQRFASLGITALVYDKRGVGESEGDYESRQSVSEKNINLLADDSIAAAHVLSKHARTKDLPLGLTGISQAGWIVPLAAEKLAAKQEVTLDFMVLWSGPVTKVSEEDIYSKYTSDFDGKTVPSYQEALQARKQKYIWPDFLGKDSDPSDSLLAINIPGLWIFGEKDGSVPVDLSIKRLKALKRSGHKVDYVLFSGLGHNNMTETFTTATEWIKQLP